jgi:hypothetical protein
VNPENRLTTIQALEHHWMTSQQTTSANDITQVNLERNSSRELVRPEAIPSQSPSQTGISTDESEMANTAETANSVARSEPPNPVQELEIDSSL